MPLVTVAVTVAALLLMMTGLKLNAFPALILAALLAGVSQGLSPEKTYESVVKGVGGQLGDLSMILGFGAMLGKVLADSGAAQRISTTMVNRFGLPRVQVAMVLTAFAMGISMFYEVAFVLMIPIVYTIVAKNRLPLLWVGLPMSIALSTMHSFLPPHPGPAAVATSFHAGMGLTLLYGLVIAMPAAAFIALTWPRLPFVRRMHPRIPRDLVPHKPRPEHELPPFGQCVAIVLVPVLLMGASAVGELNLPEGSPLRHTLDFVGKGPMALLIALIVALVVLGRRIGGPQRTLDSCTDAVKPMANIILVIGGGGALKQVLVDGGVAGFVKSVSAGWHVSPLVLAWLIAVLLRVALGSATVAVVTAAGVVAPLAATSGVSPELMVLAVSSGSIAFSHVNDPGFWLFKEFFNLSVGQALLTRTTYTTALSLIGLGGVLTLGAVVG